MIAKRARKFFPALLSNVPELLENYSPKLGPGDRSPASTVNG
jgi:hypothetical protein